MTERGFSLLEALIAAVLVAGAIGTLLHLVMRSAAQAMSTEIATVALTLAQSKVEEMRAARFAFDAGGNRIDAGTLVASSDRIGRFGEATTVDTDTAFVRRWTVDQVSGDQDTLLLTVCVEASSQRTVHVPPSCVWSIRTRQP